MSYIDIATAQLEIDEGRFKIPYDDAVGRTFKVGDTLRGNLTIGVGCNLMEGLWDDEIDYILKNRVNQAAVDAAELFNFSDAISDQRKAVLVNMAYNLGKEKLSGFHTLIACVAAQDWNAAAAAMLNSHWAAQVGARATRLAEHMKEG